MPWIAKVNTKNVEDAKNKDSRKTGDIVVFYNELPKNLSERELTYLDFIEISEAEAEEFKGLRGKVKQYYKAESDEWTDKFPQMKDGWEDEKGDVYELKERPFQYVNHDAVKGFTLNIADSAKNKETLLVAKKKEGGK